MGKVFLTYITFILMCAIFFCGCKKDKTTTSPTPTPIPKPVVYSQTIFAGNGTFGFSGDGGQATLAEIGTISGLSSYDLIGDMYLLDFSNERIRMVSHSGIITTIAGNGAAGNTGDGGYATSAEINIAGNGGFIACDVIGDIYIAETDLNRVRVISNTGIISEFAGNGYAANMPPYGGFSGDGGAATAAELFEPTSIAVDASGNVYINDSHNIRIRKVNANGVISTVAGNGTSGYSGDGGPATSAELSSEVAGIACDGNGNLYICDYSNSRIRMVNTSGIISTIAGTGIAGYSGDGGNAISAQINLPYAIAIDLSGNIYFEDAGNSCIRMISTNGIITTIFKNITASAWQIAVDANGNVYYGGGPYAYVYELTPN